MQHSPNDIKEKLLRALDKDNNVVDMAAVLEVITLLEKTHITKEALEKTRLGKYINELRKKTTNDNLARRAKELVRSWRKLIVPQDSNCLNGERPFQSVKPASPALANNRLTHGRSNSPVCNANSWHGFTSTSPALANATYHGSRPSTPIACISKTRTTSPDVGSPVPSAFAGPSTSNCVNTTVIAKSHASSDVDHNFRRRPRTSPPKLEKEFHRHGSKHKFKQSSPILPGNEKSVKSSHSLNVDIVAKTIVANKRLRKEDKVPSCQVPTKRACVDGSNGRNVSENEGAAISKASATVPAKPTSASVTGKANSSVSTKTNVGVPGKASAGVPSKTSAGMLSKTGAGVLSRTGAGVPSKVGTGVPNKANLGALRVTADVSSKVSVGTSGKTIGSLPSKAMPGVTNKSAMGVSTKTFVGATGKSSSGVSPKFNAYVSAKVNSGLANGLDSGDNSNDSIHSFIASQDHLHENDKVPSESNCKKIDNSKNSKVKRDSSDILKEKLATHARTPKVKTTAQLIEELRARSGSASTINVPVASPGFQHSDLARASSSHASPFGRRPANNVLGSADHHDVTRSKTELMEKFLQDSTTVSFDGPCSNRLNTYQAESPSGFLHDEESSDVKPGPSQPAVPDEVEAILAALPPINYDDINWDEDAIDEPDSEPKPVVVTDDVVNRLHSESWEGVNGNYDHEQQFKEWRETLSCRSFNGEVLHILPYVNID